MVLLLWCLGVVLLRRCTVGNCTVWAVQCWVLCLGNFLFGTATYRLCCVSLSTILRLYSLPIALAKSCAFGILHFLHSALFGHMAPFVQFAFRYCTDYANSNQVAPRTPAISITFGQCGPLIWMRLLKPSYQNKFLHNALDSIIVR